jgi:hypothetical protein
MTTFNINFKLTRDDDLRDDDDINWFDKKVISNEIKSWLEDLDYRVKAITINEVKK